MMLRDLPVVSYVFEAGADDRIFDSLLLIGPGLKHVGNNGEIPRHHW